MTPKSMKVRVNTLKLDYFGGIVKLIIFCNLSVLFFAMIALIKHLALKYAWNPQRPPLCYWKTYKWFNNGNSEFGFLFKNYLLINLSYLFISAIDKHSSIDGKISFPLLII